MRMVLQKSRQLLGGLVWLYVLGVMVLGLLWLAGIHGRWWLDLLNIFALYVFAPLVVLVPLAWLLGARRLRVAASLALAIFVALFGQQFIPRAAAQASGTPLRVATLNLHYSLEPAQLEAMLAAIRAETADVVALQELSIPAATAIKQGLLRDYPYQILEPSDISFTGLGVISRYALERQRPAQKIPAQLIHVRVAGVSVSLLNVSLTSPEIKRRRLPVVGWVQGLGGYQIKKRTNDIAQLLPAIDQIRGPLVIAGDFNLSDREADYAQFATRLHDAFRETTWGFGHTFPNNLRLGPVPIPFPLIRIDYVWSAGGVAPTSAHVACGSASDHCMVVSDLHISAQPALGQGL